MTRAALLGFALCLLVIAGSANAGNATEAPTPTPAPSPTPVPAVPQVIREPGKQIRFKLSDGREAALFTTRRPAMTYRVPFGLSETTCAASMGARADCAFAVPLKRLSFRLRWIKHSDPVKVGKSVAFFGTEIFDSIDFTVKQQLDGLAEARDLAPLTMHCEDFTWLTGTKDAPAQFSMAEWSAEGMGINSETGGPENKVFLGHYSPELIRTNDRELTLAKTGAWFGYFDLEFRNWFMSADIIEMSTFPRPPAPSCQMSIKPNFSSTRQVVADYEKNFSVEEPYLEGSDSIFDSIISSDTNFLGVVLKEPESEWN